MYSARRNNFLCLPPGSIFFLLHSSNGKRKKKRKKPSERRLGKGSWRGAVMRVEEKSGLQDGCSFEERRSIFFKWSGYASLIFLQEKHCQCGSIKISVLHSGFKLQLVLLPSWSSGISTQLSSFLSSRLSLLPWEMRPRNDPVYLHLQAQSALKNTSTYTNT